LGAWSVPDPVDVATIYLWPSSILLLSTAGSEHTFTAFALVAIAILVNVALYCVVGLFALMGWVVARSFLRNSRHQ
jgi:hypothetical protein